MTSGFISQLEQTEITAWKDLWDAAPGTFSEQMGLGYESIGGGFAVFLKAMPIPLFNRTIGLGISQPVTDVTVARLLEKYGKGSDRSFMIHHFEGMAPSHASYILEKHGLRIGGGWERIYRDNHRQESFDASEHEITVSRVNQENHEEWADFVCRVYNLPFHDWLLSLYNREGWHHYIAMENNRVIAARSFFLSSCQWVWSGIDAPVPGIMTSCYLPDRLIWQQAIQDLNRLGALYYVADIEKTSARRDHEGYQVFLNQLGFVNPYLRAHYVLA